MKKIIILLTSFNFFLMQNLAEAQATFKTSLEAASIKTSPIITFGYIMQVIISLMVVLGLLYISGKYLFPRLQITAKGRNIKVLERLGLEPQVTAYILNYKEKSWLLVASQKNVTVIDQVETTESES